MADLLFKISAVIHILIVIFNYVPKKKTRTLDYYSFNALLIGSSITLILDLLSVFLGIYYKEHIISPIISKIYLCTLIIWMIMFVQYVKLVTSPDNIDKIYLKDKENSKVYYKMIAKSAIAAVIAIIGIALIPLVLTTDGESLFMSGKCMLFFNICYILCIVTWLVSIIKNKSNLTASKLAPLIASTFFATISLIVQFARPEHPVMSFAMSLITMITYHGIHNPDLAAIEALDEATQRANAANRAKSDFLSSMSHEIRTPLNAIVGFSQALGKKELSGQAKEEVKEILDASNSLLETINGILDISKLEANKIELIKQDYSTEAFINEIKTLAHNRLGKKTLDLRYEIDDNLPKVLYGDQQRLKQIIMNIISNGIKYTNEGHVTTKIEALTNKEKCQLKITVEDTGIGMSKEELEMIFVKFQRFDLDKYTGIAGTGLGMAITKQLIELMNGEINIESEPGKGTTFTIKLEQELSTKTLEEVLDEYAAHTINPFDASGNRVLVVDDNNINLKVAERFLEQYQLDLDFCTSGRECIDKILKNEIYDLILLDIMMPRMKGTEVIKELKQIPGFEIPVVALTADILSDLGRKYTDLGFDDCISKPIVEEDLYNVLKKFLKEKTEEEKAIIEAHKAEIKEELPRTNNDIEFNNLPDVNYLSEIMEVSQNDIFPQQNSPINQEENINKEQE